MTLDDLALSNTNSLWGALTVEVLVRLGLRFAVIAPGSRSTPLTYAFSRHKEIESIPILDERSAAFFALGVAKRTHCATALVCTSGTAAANFYPAVIEAREGGVPMLIFTADRPPEMRHCHSGQTIDQSKLYGTYPNFQAELAMPDRDPRRLNYLRQTLLHGWERTVYPTKGPVHFNVPFRDPLAPSAGRREIEEESEFDSERYLSNLKPVIPITPTAERKEVGPLLKEMAKTKRGLIVVGPVQPECGNEFAKAVAQASQALGWPVLADALGPLRSRASLNPQLICHYDTILRNTESARRLAPAAVLSVGPLPTSKILRGWLDEREAKTWVLDTGSDNVDCLHRRAETIRIPLQRLAKEFGGRLKRSSIFCSDWLAVERRARRAISRRMGTCKFRFEGKIPWLLSRMLPAGTSLFVANSMPVRDMEYFWQSRNRAVETYFNRGGNGIDGTLSTALGVAHGSGGAVLLTGDLAFLHDINGLLTLPKFRGHLTIVLINNGGGGLFESLPIAKLDPPFEEYFATPQEVSFRILAKAHGVDYLRIGDLDEELPALLRKLPKEGIRLLEIVADRKKDHRWRERIFHEISAKL